MRKLDAKVSAAAFGSGGLRLTLTTMNGEVLATDLDHDKSEEFLKALDEAWKETNKVTEFKPTEENGANAPAHGKKRKH